jgi:hypothetical protein
MIELHQFLLLTPEIAVPTARGGACDWSSLMKAAI